MSSSHSYPFLNASISENHNEFSLLPYLNAAIVLVLI